MFCHECRTKLPDSARFCLRCGIDLSAVIEHEYEANESERPTSKQKATFSIVILIMLIGTLVGVVAQQLAISNSTATSNSFSTPVAYNPPPPQPVLKTQSYPVTVSAFIVDAGSYRYWEIKVDQSMLNFRVQGRFTVSGGSGNDIYAFMTDADGFINFKNKNRYLVWYESGKVTVGNIDVQLSPKTYYLVFSNQMAWISNKAISAEITATYDYY